MLTQFSGQCGFPCPCSCALGRLDSQGSGSLPQARPTTCCGRRPVLWLLLVVAAPRPASLPPRQQQQRLASSDLGRGWWSLPQGPERPASRDTRLPPVWPCVALCGPVCCAQFQPRLLAARGQTSPHLPHLVSPLGHTTGNTHTRLPMTFRKRPEGEFATKPSRLVRLERPLVINLDWVPPPPSPLPTYMTPSGLPFPSSNNGSKAPGTKETGQTSFAALDYWWLWHNSHASTTCTVVMQ